MLPDNNPSNRLSPNPYSFITDSHDKPKTSLKLPGGMKGRIILVVGLFVLLIIAFLVVSSFLGKAGKDQVNKYVEINQRQTEIIRLSGIAETKSKSFDVKSSALTTKLSLSTSQTEVSDIIKQRGVSAKELTKKLSASKNADTDATLTEAEQNNRFDETYQKIIAAELANYQKQLSDASSGASKSELVILESAFNQAKILSPPETK